MAYASSRPNVADVVGAPAASLQVNCRRLVAALLIATLSSCTTLPGRPIEDSAQAVVAFDRASERGSWAHGLADPATGRPATVDDPVRIASVSKLVVAIGVMRLVEKGVLDLDEDIASYLGWSLRNPGFPDREISLRQLLSHTSSLRDGDDAYVVPLGHSLKEALEAPGVWDSEHGPGDGYFAYANFNFPVVASVMERATGERFDLLMRRLVLAPMKLDACFNWPTCSDSAVARAIVLTQEGKAIRDDLGGMRPPCPVFVRDGDNCDLARWQPGANGALFSPQGGLRISARDLARVGRMLLGRGTIDGAKILTPQSVAMLLSPAWKFNGNNGSRGGESEGVCSYGLATQQLATNPYRCADDPEGRGRRWTGHSGDAYGLRSGLWIDEVNAVGIAYYVTGLPPTPPPGRSDFSAAEERAFGRATALLRNSR